MQGRITLTGEADLAQASGLRQELVAQLESGAPTTLDCTALEDIDLACLQVLLAARRGFGARGVALHVEDSATHLLRTRCGETGLKEILEEGV